jgi:CheY-like chemotaxis protein
MKPMDKPIILIIEDDEPKLQVIKSFLEETILDGVFEIATSVSSAIKILSSCEVDLAIVDISLPTYDVAKDRTGGQPQGYGGVNILRFIEDMTPSTYSIILTQYEEFPSEHYNKNKSLSELAEELQQKFGSQLLAVIHYAGQLGDWRNDLFKALIKSGIKINNENINS